MAAGNKLAGKGCRVRYRRTGAGEDETKIRQGQSGGNGNPEAMKGPARWVDLRADFSRDSHTRHTPSLTFLPPPIFPSPLGSSPMVSLLSPAAASLFRGQSRPSTRAARVGVVSTPLGSFTCVLTNRPSSVTASAVSPRVTSLPPLDVAASPPVAPSMSPHHGWLEAALLASAVPSAAEEEGAFAPRRVRTLFFLGGRTRQTGRVISASPP